MSEPYWEPLAASPVVIPPSGVATVGITLPASPINDQEAILVDSLTVPTYAWRFKYLTAITDVYKWLFIGGSPVRAAVETTQAGTTVGSYGDLATPGPTLALARAGIYDIEFNCLLYQGNVNGWCNGYSTVYVNGAQPTDYPLMIGTVYPTSVPYATLSGKARNTVPAAAVLLQKYQTVRVGATAGDPSWALRRLLVTPVRVA